MCDIMYVRYGSKGLFKVKEICKRIGTNGVKEDWYVLESHKDGVDTSVMTPCHNARIRPVLSKAKIQELIEDMPSIQSIWIDDKRERFAKFHTILDSNNLYELVQMIKSIYLMQKHKEAEGKKLCDKDKEMFVDAENLLFEEISLSYNIRKEEVMDFIMSRVKE